MSINKKNCGDQVIYQGLMFNQSSGQLTLFPNGNSVDLRSLISSAETMTYLTDLSFDNGNLKVTYTGENGLPQEKSVYVFTPIEPIQYFGIAPIEVSNTGAISIQSGFIPTHTSDLINDSDFIDQSFLPTLTSELTNDSGFLTIDDLPPDSQGVWGAITGTITDQTDLQSALGAKQATLISGTNIKTLNSQSLLGSGNITITADFTNVAYTNVNNSFTVPQTITKNVNDANPSFIVNNVQGTGKIVQFQNNGFERASLSMGGVFETLSGYTIGGQNALIPNGAALEVGGGGGFTGITLLKETTISNLANASVGYVKSSTTGVLSRQTSIPQSDVTGLTTALTNVAYNNINNNFPLQTFNATAFNTNAAFFTYPGSGGQGIGITYRGISFPSDNNSAVYFPAGGSVAAVGTLTLSGSTVISTSDTSISKATPVLKLIPTSNSQTSSLLFTAADGTTTRGGISFDLGAGEMKIGGLSTGGYFPTFYSNNAEIMRINTSGQVGIGTGSSTAARLHVVTTGADQFRLGYDLSNYMTQTMSSTGSATFELVGSAPNTFTFGKSISVHSQNGIVKNAVTLGASDSGYGGVGYNIKFTLSSDAYEYANTFSDYANFLMFDSGAFRFRTAGQNVAPNAISFTDRMILSATGVLRIHDLTNASIGYVKSGTDGTISRQTGIPDADLSANIPLLNASNVFSGGFNSFTRAGDNYLNVINSTAGIQTAFGNTGTTGYVGNFSGHPLEFRTNNVGRITIGTAGAIQFNTGYGVGFIKSDASGNLTSGTIAQSDVTGLTAALTNVAYTNVANSFTQNQTITQTTGNQLTLAYDGSNTTTFQTASNGALTITPSGGATGIVGTLAWGNANSNLGVPSAASASTTTSATSLFAGASTVAYRAVMRGSSAYTAAANTSITNLLIGQTAITEAGSGTHALISSAVIRASTITGGAATVTNTATLYIDAAASTTVTGGNYALWIDDGSVRVDTLAAGTGSRTVMADANGVLYSEANTVTSAGTFAVPATSGYYTFNGTTSTWTLPAIAGNTGVKVTIMNQGSGTITLNSNAGGNDIFDTVSSASINIPAGETAVLYNNSLKYTILV